MDREPLTIPAGRDHLEEMAACASALAHAHEGEFGVGGAGITKLFARCSEQLKTAADSEDRTVDLDQDLTGDTDESVFEASKRLREVYDLELGRNAADPWCLVLRRLVSVIDDEAARRSEGCDLPVM
jgi:hypothetical protein